MVIYTTQIDIPENKIGYSLSGFPTKEIPSTLGVERQLDIRV